MATNEILPFASTNTGTNLLTQAEYAADAQRTTGNQPGIARSKLVNKSLRQTSLLAAGLAEFIADWQANNVTDGLTPQQIADYLLAALSAAFPQATDTVQGKIELATIAEAIAGTDAQRAITPATLWATFPYVVPSGSVIYVAQNTAPNGFIKANGAAVSRSTYATLFAAIGTTFGSGNGSTTFNIPDLRGEFIRGWDDSRGIDGGRAFGSSQEDALQGHNHRVFYQPYAGGGYTQWNTNVAGFSNGDAISAMIAKTMESDGVNGTPRVGSETRPRNVALLACIKY